MATDSERQLQPDIVQQHRERSSSGWKAILTLSFIVTLLIGNLAIISKTLKGFETGGLFAIGGFVGTIMAVAIIDVMAVLVYIYTHHSQGHYGPSRFISYAVLTVAVFVFILLVIVMFAVFNLFS